ncbi:FUSC family protein [Haloglycomyces albus]|uniref:FUSC family protein n=1 Tax=Haloglycomyces albus TaxID=526067 RepID=UPI00046CC185|nr:FUSC family protein [Haloglycomyces albus]
MVKAGIQRSGAQIRDNIKSWTPNEVTPYLAVKCAVGMAVAMGITAALGNPSWSIALMIGAWLGGVGLVTPTARSQASTPLLIGIAGSVVVVLGAITHPLPLLLASAAFAVVMTYVGTIGPNIGATSITVGIVFFLSEQITADTTPFIAALAVAGGCGIQALLTFMPPYQRWTTDRAYLAGAWKALADEAAELAENPEAPLTREEVLTATDQLEHRRRLPESITAARNQIYEIVGAINRVSAARSRLSNTDPDAADLYSDALLLASQVLRTYAESITARKAVSPNWDELLQQLGRHPVATATGTIPVEIGGLLRVLHDADGYAARIISGNDDIISTGTVRHARSQMREGMGRLRTNLRLSSPTAHHAWRHGIVVASAQLIALYFWPGTHGYWIPLTAWIVLQADYAGTLTRGTVRALGTAAGVLLASVISLFIPHLYPVILGMVLLWATVAYLARPVSPMLWNAAVAAYTVFQIDLAGTDVITSGLERVSATLIGAGLALLLYLLTPTWQTRRLGDLLADLIDSYRDYARIVMDRQAHPVDYDANLMRTVIDNVRVNRQAVRTAVDKAAAEPVGGTPESSDVTGVEDALNRAARALIAINADIGRKETTDIPEIDDFANAVDTTYMRLSARARGEAPPGTAVDLEAAAETLMTKLQNGSAASAGRRNVLGWEIQNLVEALQDTQLLVSGW